MQLPASFVSGTAAQTRKVVLFEHNSINKGSNAGRAFYAAPQIADGARTAVFGSRVRAQGCALVEHEPDDARRGPDGLGAGAGVGAERIARPPTGGRWSGSSASRRSG